MRRIQAIAASPEYDLQTGRFSCTIATQHRGIVAAMLTWIDKAPLSLGLGKAYKKRTTGEKSQNHHYWGHLQQLVTAATSPVCGTDIDALDYTMRYRAISWGWPFTLVTNIKVPKSETEATTYEYGRLIDCLHNFADEQGFVLYEGEDNEDEEHRAFLEINEK
jgi:hypothetical protein